MEINYRNAVCPTVLESAVLNTESDSQIKMGIVHANVDKTKLGIQMKLLVRILQYFGGHPLKIKIPENNAKNIGDLPKPLNVSPRQNYHIQNIFYETTIFKWADARAWYSYGAVAFKMFSVLTHLFNIGWGIWFPVKLFSFDPELQKIFWTKQKDTNYNGIVFAGNVLLNILKTILIFWNTPEFVCWLNTWYYFERDFKTCFKTDAQLDIGRFSNRILILYLALPTLFWTVSAYSWIPMHIFYVKILSITCMIVVVTSTYIHPLLEDAKVLIMIKTQVVAFERILVGIKESTQSRNLVISAADVIGWRDLVKQVREQTALASECIKGQEMMSIAETIVSCSTAVSYVLITLTQNTPMVDSIIFALLMNLNSCCQFLARLYFKVFLTEKITCAERLVADKVLQIESTTRDSAIKTELKFMYTQMVQNAVAINFGKYFALDKKLLLNVGAQVVTYLIVIMQFQSSKQF